MNQIGWNITFLTYEFAHSDSLVTLIVLMTAEFLPKVFSNLCQWFNQIFCFASLCFLLVILFHFEFLNLSFWLCLKILWNGWDQIQLYFSKVELGNYITEQMSSVEDDDDVDSEIQMFQNALNSQGWRREILWAQNRARGHWIIWLYSRTERIIHWNGLF
jgi:hypothetical protein